MANGEIEDKYRYILIYAKQQTSKPPMAACSS